MSERFKLDGVDLYQVGRTLLIAMTAAALPTLTEAVANADFGVYDAIITSVLVVGLDAARRWTKDNTKK